MLYSNSISPLIVGLDLPTLAAAREMAKQLKPCSCVYKIGLELLPIGGTELASELVQQGHKVFLDFKLHDIPRTVEAATRSIGTLGADFLTVHALPQVMAAALQGRERESSLKILGVTVLTSLDDVALSEMGYRYSVKDLVLKRVETALSLGCDGVVASPLEVEDLRTRFGKDFLIVTPGIRFGTHLAEDQKRIATPKAARQKGASHIVVGRPVLQAENPLEAAQSILGSLGELE